MIMTWACMLVLTCSAGYGLRLGKPTPELDPKEIDSLYDGDDDIVKEFPRLKVFTAANKLNRSEIPDKIKGGIAYIKVEKVGGSTWAGVMRRIGKRHGLNHFRDAYWLEQAAASSEIPGASVWANHGYRRDLDKLLEKLMPNAILVTLIRDPVECAMSSFYYCALKFGWNITDASKLRYLQGNIDHAKEDFEAQNQRLQNHTKRDFESQYITSNESQTPEQIVKNYNFIGITERFDESLLILGQKLGLAKSDLLYLKSKDSHKESARNIKKRETSPHPPFSQESKTVRDAALKLRSGKDGALYQLANKRLNKAIVEYGNTFETDLEDFRTMLKELEDICRPHFEESCLWLDNGCAQECIDNYVRQH